MKEKYSKIYYLNIKSFLFFLLYSIIYIAPIASKKKEKETKSTDLDTNNKGFFDNNDVDFFIPKYDFQRPYKYQKKSYQDLYNNLNSNSTTKETEVMSDVFIFSDAHLKETDNFYKTEILDNIIKREVNIEDVKLTSDNDVFGYPDSKYFDESSKIIKDDDVKIKNFSEMGVSLSFNPNNLVINDK